jgi:hypothetical protein
LRKKEARLLGKAPLSKWAYRQQKQNKKSVSNLLEAIKQGKATDILLEELEKLKAEGAEIRKQIASESKQTAVLTVPQVKVFLSRFKDGNINDIQYRRSLVDTFVNKIYLHDDKMTILYNAQDSHSDVLFNIALVDARGVEPLSENRSCRLSPSASHLFNVPSAKLQMTGSWF